MMYSERLSFGFILFLLIFKFSNGENDTIEDTCDEKIVVDLFTNLVYVHGTQEKLLEQLKKDAKGQTCLFSCPEKTRSVFKHNWRKSCAEIIQQNDPEGVYSMQIPAFNNDPFHAHCIHDPNNKGPAWTVIFRRSNKRLRFNRNLRECQTGFGSLYDDHLLSLDAVFAMTNFQRHELWIKLSTDTKSINIQYSNFFISNKQNSYALLSLGDFTADSETENNLESHVGQILSTKDNDDSKKCTTKNNTWWHYRTKTNCFSCNLFGVPDVRNGIFWNKEEFNYAHMMIRPFPNLK